MPFATIDESPLLAGVRPIKIYYREQGEGQPLIFLHGGWGYAYYPFDRQIEFFGNKFKIIIPDRSGYGQSSRIAEFPDRFHQCAAREMISFLDALNIERAILWGHSDGAVIAAIMGLAAPDRFPGIIMEAFHYYRAKFNSIDFFQAMATAPDQFGQRICDILAAEHGEDYWRALISASGRAWLKIIAESDRTEKDFFDGRLAQLKPATIFLHGSLDKRTEAGELNSLRSTLPNAAFNLIEDAGHSPHSGAAAQQCNIIVDRFLQGIIN